MKATQNIDWPIISATDANDERAEGTFLLNGNHEGKTTATDMVEYWHIREWEPYIHDGVLCWFDRSGYSLYKDMVKTLSALQA